MTARGHYQDLPDGGQVWVPAEPPAVGVDTVVGRAPDAVWVRIADETVVYRAADATSHVLNREAGLMWECLDGRAALGEILDDFADVFELPPDQAAADFLPVVATWLLAEIAEEVGDDQ